MNVLNEELDRIKSIMGLIVEQSSPVLVTGTFTGGNCDEIHAFQSTSGKVIGNMNVKVGQKLEELYNKGINPMVSNVSVKVNNLTVSWTCTIVPSTDGKAYVGFTSRGAGCSGSDVSTRAESAAEKKDIGSIKSNIESTYGEPNIDIQMVNDHVHNGGNNSFRQIFYRYTKPKSFPPIGGKVSSTNNPSNNTINITSPDLTTFLSNIKSKTVNQKIDLNSITIDVDKNTMSFNTSDNGRLVKTMVLALSTKSDGNKSTDNIISKNPGSSVVKTGTFENGSRTFNLIAIF